MILNFSLPVQKKVLSLKIFFVKKFNLAKSLFITGPDMWKATRYSDNTLEDIQPSKIVLYYEAKACYKHVCKDLSGNFPPRHGRFTGHKIYTWDIKVRFEVKNGKFSVHFSFQ